MSKLSPVQIEVLWQRLITSVDEAVTTLVQASFSSVIRDFHDYACAVFDTQGRLLAQSTHSTPGLLGILPLTMPNFLRHKLARELGQGDVLITNDPWLASGHLIDITVATPVFQDRKLVGFALCVVHHLNMGGRHATLASRDIYEEGLKIPILRLYRAGEPVEEVFEFIRANVREPEKVIGDLRAQVSANQAAAAKLAETMVFGGLDDLSELGDEILSRSEASMRRAIAELPDFVASEEMTLKGVAGLDEDILLRLTVRVEGDDIELDFAGSSPQVKRAVNVPINMTRSYSVFMLKCVLDPDIPNNGGCLAPFRITAPLGSVLNAEFPAATWGRTMIAHMLPELIGQALAKAIPDKVIAGSGSTPLWYGNFVGRWTDGRSFFAVATFNGGMGARATKDGVGGISFPANVANIPLEVIETDSPLLFERKEFAPAYAGHGKTRGGAGQHIVISLPADAAGKLDGPLWASVRGGRFGAPVRGVLDGANAREAVAELNGSPIELGHPFEMNPGDRLELVIPGGGGYGPPTERDPRHVAQDILDGLISSSEAAKIHPQFTAGAAAAPAPCGDHSGRGTRAKQEAEV